MKRTFADFENKAKLACFSIKNDKLPHEIAYASHDKRWFECDKCTHSFMAKIGSITRGSWCPFCANQVLCGDKNCKTCFQKSYEYHAGALAQHWSSKNAKLAHEVSRCSKTKYYHHCVQCEHDFLMSPNAILGTHKNWCNFCANIAKCPESENCSKCFAKTFASYKDKAKLACFSSKNDKRPYEITYASGTKRWFQCDKCAHSFMKRIDNVTLRGIWCPFCANQALCGDRNCKTCFEKSYEYHAGALAQHWSSKNAKLAHEVSRGSNTKYYHHCIECEHDFLMNPSAILGKNKSWCNFCANRARCPKSEDCSKCFANTFASWDAEKVSCWASCNVGVPYDYARASHHHAHFDCKECQTQFKMRIDKVTVHDQWCPNCQSSKASKNVETLSSVLQSLAGITFTKENTVKCQRRSLRWDFVVSNGANVFYIENDGEHHFSLLKNMQISRSYDFDSGKRHFADQRAKDLLKDGHIRATNELLFRVSYRQLRLISELVGDMIKQSNAGVTGVVYMDEELYKDWGPIDF